LIEFAVDYEQPELPLEFPMSTADHYTIELRKGPNGDPTEIVRTHTATNVTDAEALIEGLRDSAFQREEVTWQSEEVNAEGNLYGLAPHGVVYQIAVRPALNVALA
jgi:hypothetical protein